MPGKKSRQGSRKMSWRVRERKRLILARPMFWKKLPMTICAPMTGNIATQMRNPCAAMSMRTSSLVNTADTAWGNNSQMRKPLVVMHTPQVMARRSVCFTRSGLRAPKL